jgi:hypothetical protein
MNFFSKLFLNGRNLCVKIKIFESSWTKNEHFKIQERKPNLMQNLGTKITI